MGTVHPAFAGIEQPPFSGQAIGFPLPEINRGKEKLDTASDALSAVRAQPFGAAVRTLVAVFKEEVAHFLKSFRYSEFNFSALAACRSLQYADTKSPIPNSSTESWKTKFPKISDFDFAIMSNMQAGEIGR